MAPTLNVTGLERHGSAPMPTWSGSASGPGCWRTAAKLSLVDQTKVVTAVSELARNTLIHGGGGHAELATANDGRRNGVLATFVDTGPGIPDLDQALTDGWTSGSGMGLGLSGARRLVDDFTLDSEPGRGTTVRIVKWAR